MRKECVGKYNNNLVTCSMAFPVHCTYVETNDVINRITAYFSHVKVLVLQFC